MLGTFADGQEPRTSDPERARLSAPVRPPDISAAGVSSRVRPVLPSPRRSSTIRRHMHDHLKVTLSEVARTRIASYLPSIRVLAPPFQGEPVHEVARRPRPRARRHRREGHPMCLSCSVRLSAGCRTAPYRCSVRLIWRHRTTSGALAGRPKRVEIFARLDKAFVELRERLGGLPDPTEADDIWTTIWYEEAHNSTALEGNTLVLRQVETLSPRVGRSGTRSSGNTWK